MAPERKRTRAASTARQRSIADYFSPSPGPSAGTPNPSHSPLFSRMTIRVPAHTVSYAPSNSPTGMHPEEPPVKAIPFTDLCTPQTSPNDATPADVKQDSCFVAPSVTPPLSTKPSSKKRTPKLRSRSIEPRLSKVEPRILSTASLQRTALSKVSNSVTRTDQASASGREVIYLDTPENEIVVCLDESEDVEVSPLKAYKGSLTTFAGDGDHDHYQPLRSVSASSGSPIHHDNSDGCCQNCLSDAAPGDVVMNIARQLFPEDTDDKPMTQEEECVNERLRTLNCSGEMQPENAQMDDSQFNESPEPYDHADEKKFLSASAPQEAKEGPMVRSDSSSADSNASGEDDEELLQENLLQPRRSARLQAVADSAASRNMFSSRGASVPHLRSSVFQSNKLKRPVGRIFAVTPSTSEIVRQRTQKLEKERNLERLRMEIQTDSRVNFTMHSDEAALAEIAVAEDRKRQLRDQLYEQHERPTPLFVRDLRARKQNRFIDMPPSTDLLALDPVHRCLVLTSNAPLVDVGEILSTHLIHQHSKKLGGISDIAMRRLFEYVVYDDTLDECGTRTRHSIFLALCNMMSMQPISWSPNSFMPTLVEVLRAYGADFAMAERSVAGVPTMPSGVMHQNMPDEILFKLRDMEEGSLDYEAVKGLDAGVHSNSMRALRNLGRTFQIFAVAVAHGAPLVVLCAKSSESLHKQLTDFEYALDILATCARILVSPFGCRVSRDVGKLISAVVDRIPEGEWPSFRLLAAHKFADASTRLFVQVELVTYLLPFLSDRARGLNLDVTFLLFWRGCGPKGRDCYSPSLHAESVGLGFISYTTQDILDLLADIPELSGETDSAWACGMMRLLKQTVGDEDVLSRFRYEDMEQLSLILKKYRKASVRLGDSVQVQDMRIAIDALRYIVQSAVSDQRRNLRLGVDGFPIRRVVQTTLNNVK